MKAYMPLLALAILGCKERPKPIAKAVLGSEQPCAMQDCKVYIPHNEMVPQPAKKELRCQDGYTMVAVIDQSVAQYYYNNGYLETWPLCVPTNLIPKPKKEKEGKHE